MLRLNSLRRLFQVAHPAVVPQPLPQLVELIVRAVGKDFDVRERFQKTGVVALYRLYPGLLQHDLREPHMVGLFIRPPGEISPTFPIPGDQKAGKGFANIQIIHFRPPCQ